MSGVAIAIASRVATFVLGAVLTLAAVLGTASQQAHAARKDASIVVDANSGKVLHNHLADAKRFPASLTKMMTVYVMFEMLRDGRLKLDTPLVASAKAAAQQPSKVYLKKGESITVRDAIAALCTKSANDVAMTVAENLGGSEAKFASYMTWKARQIGLKNTVFRNASGLPNSKQTTTARDMATLGMRLIDDFPQYYSNFNRTRFSYRGKTYRNHNRLLTTYEGTDGIKTGYIRASGFNLVASVRRGNKHLIGVVMGGKSGKQRNAEMKRVLDKSWAKASTTRTRSGGPSWLQNLSSLVTGGSGSATAARGFDGISRATPAAAATRVASASAVRTTDASEAPARAQKKKRTGGSHLIQVGAYVSRKLARKRLTTVKGIANGLLDDARALTTSGKNKRGKRIHRARFAGFDEPEAASVCATLKKRKVPCIVMRSR